MYKKKRNATKTHGSIIKLRVSRGFQCFYRWARGLSNIPNNFTCWSQRKLRVSLRRCTHRVSFPSTWCVESSAPSIKSCTCIIYRSAYVQPWRKRTCCSFTGARAIEKSSEHIKVQVVQVEDTKGHRLVRIWVRSRRR